MTLLRNGTVVADPRLDRLRSLRTDHLEKYPLTAATLPSAATPVVMGVNWYTNFDRPRLTNIKGTSRYVIGDGDLGSLRGGHCTCLPQWGYTEPSTWWSYYNQGEEGRCVEFGSLRALSLMNRKRYDITSRWHYWMAQHDDEWAGGSYPGASPQYEGTSVRAELEVLRRYGAVKTRLLGLPLSYEAAAAKVQQSEGIAAYRWATNWSDVRRVLGVPDDLPGVPMLNSWGKDYPREVLLLDHAGERLLNEDGEFGVVTDR